MPRGRYIKRDPQLVVAVRLDLETKGFHYRKWNHDQHCKPGDWIVDNNGDVYTIDAQSFADTYREQSRGLYKKVAPVWAEQANSPGTINTKEGATDYQAGDYLVFNRKDGGDGYAISKAKFEAMYVAADKDF